MSLKRREFLAAVLLLAAAILWTWGQQSIRLAQISGLTPTGTAQGGVTQATAQGGAETGTEAPGSATEATGEAEEETQAARARTLGLILSFAAGLPGGAAVFALRNRRPLLGVDGSAAVLSALAWALLRGELLWGQGAGRMLLRLALAYGVLVFLRELWGWLRERCCLRWCLCYRLAAPVVQPCGIWKAVSLGDGPDLSPVRSGRTGAGGHGGPAYGRRPLQR